MSTRVRRRISLKKVVILAAICIGCFVAVLFFNQFAQISKLDGQIRETSAQYADELQKSKEIDERGDVYASNEYVEQEARKMGLVRPDERIYIDANNTTSK